MALTKVSKGLISTSIVDNGNATAITIDSAGSATFSNGVTLLKTTADATLEVQTTFAGADARLNLYGHSTGTSQIRFGDEASVNVGLLTYNHADDSLTARVGGSDALTIDANGNLDIGLPYPITGLRGARRLVLNGIDQGVDFVAYASDNGLVDGQYIGGFLFGNDDNNATEDHFAGMWANASSTAGSMDLRFAAGRDNYENNTPHMIIDTSGNLLVGKTASAIGTAGTEIYGTGVITSTRAGNILDLNRLSADGTIAQFRKDGTVIGNIASYGASRLSIGSGDVGLVFASDFDAIYPSDGGLNSRDNAVNLGLGSVRFKNLYLSGGVFLGGTGAANKLDDYEEGTWTPIVVAYSGTQPTVSGSSSGWYTKIGQLVTAHFNLDSIAVSGTTSGILEITGLPFTLSGELAAAYTANQITLQRPDISCVMALGNSLGILSQNNGGSWAWELISILDGGSAMRATVTYRTNS